MGVVATLEGLERRIRNALALHEPQPLCSVHFQTDDCGERRIWRCFICRQTRDYPCATWRCLTERKSPDEA